MARPRLDRTGEHILAADLLFQIFKASMALEGLCGQLRSKEVQTAMVSVARGLSQLRRALHVEFSRRAPFGSSSPYDFEGRLDEDLRSSQRPD